MTEQLVISALGEDKPGIVKSLSKCVLDCGGNIAESHMTVLGGEFALMALVTGEPAALDRIEEDLLALKTALSLILISKRTRGKVNGTAGVPYNIAIISMDHPGIVHNVTDYLSEHQINVETLQTNSYAAAHTGTMMFSLDIAITLPSTANIAEFRKHFSHFCDDLNLDVSFTARK